MTLPLHPDFIFSIPPLLPLVLMMMMTTTTIMMMKLVVLSVPYHAIPLTIATNWFIDFVHHLL